MPKYNYNGSPYDIPQHKVEMFLKLHPGATLTVEGETEEIVIDEAKTNGVVETDASVTPVNNQASTTDLNLEPGSSELVDPVVEPVKPKISQAEFDGPEEEELIKDLRKLYPDMDFQEGVPFSDVINVKVPGDDEYTPITLNSNYNIKEGGGNENAYSQFLEIAERSKGTKNLATDVFKASNGVILNNSDRPKFDTTNRDERLGGEELLIDGLVVKPNVGDDNILDVLATIEGEVLNLFENPQNLLLADDSTGDVDDLLVRMQEGVTDEKINLVAEQSFENVNKALNKDGLPPLTEDSYEELFYKTYKKIQNKAIKKADIEFNNSTLGVEFSTKFFNAVDSNFTTSLPENKRKKVELMNKVLELTPLIQEAQNKLNQDPSNAALQTQLDGLQAKLKIIPGLIKGIEEGDTDVESTYFDPEAILKNPVVAEMQNDAVNGFNVGKNIANNLYENDKSLTRQQYALQLFKDKTFRLQNIQSKGAEEKVSFNVKNMSTSVISGGIDASTGIKFGGGGEKIDIDNGILRKLKSGGYLPDKDGNIEISPFGLQQLGLDSRNFEGFIDRLNSSKYISDADLIKIQAYEEQYNEVYSEAKGLFRLSKLNIDPSKTEKNIFIGNIAATGVRAMLTQWGGRTQDEAEKILTGDEFARTSLDRFNSAMGEYNSSEEVLDGNVGKIQLSKDQVLNLDTNWSEEISEGVGNFVPMLVELGAITYATAGIGSATGFVNVLNGLKNGNRMQKATRHAYMGMLEEAKMQTAFDMKAGGGATFYGLGVATQGITPFKNKWKWLDPFYQKVIKAGPVGAISTKTAVLTEAAYSDMFGNNKLDFNNEYNAMFSDGDEFLKTSFIDMMVFKIAGVHGLKKTDLMSTGSKTRLFDAAVKKRDALIETQEGSTTIGPEGQQYFKRNEKKYDDLNPKEKDLYDSYQEIITTMGQMTMVENHSEKLNPKSKNFETNFKKMQSDPVNKIMKEIVPGYKGFEIQFVDNKKANADNVMAFNEKALFVKAPNGTQKDIVYINKDKYTVGVGLHEFGHVIVENWTKGQKNVFIEKAGKMFKDIEFYIPDLGKSIKGSKLRDLIKKEYSTEATKDKDIVAKELLSYIIEFTANPEFYYKNPNAASSFLKEMKMEMQDYIREKGYFKTMLAPKTAGDVVRLLAQVGQSSRAGEPISEKIKSAFTALDNININTLEMTNLKNQAQEVRLKRAASKEIGFKAKEYLKEGYDNKSLVSIINSPSSTSSQKGGAVQAIIQKNFGLIKNKLGWQDWGKKGITKEGIINAIEEQIIGAAPGRDGTKGGQKGIFDNYNPDVKTGGSKVSTRLGDIVGNRVGEILERAKQLEELTKEGQSLDSEKAPQIEGSYDSFKNEGPEIKKRNLAEKLGIKESVDKLIAKELGITEKTTSEQKISIVKESLKDLTYKGTKNKIKDIIDAKLTDKFLEDLARRPVLAMELYELTLAKGVTSKGLSTGVKGKLLEYFYDLSEGKRLDAKDGKSTSGLQRQIKQKFDLDTFKKFVTRQIDPKTGKLERKTDSYLRRLDAFRQEAGKAITNQQMRELGVDLIERAPELKDMLMRAGDGRAPAMASKMFDIAKDMGYKDLSLKQREEGFAMLQENKEKFIKEYPILADVLTEASFQYFRGKVKSSKNPSFKSMAKEMPDFIETPFINLNTGKRFKISKNEILTEGVGVGMFGQVSQTKTVINKSGKKVKVKEKLFETYDTVAIQTFLEGNLGKDGVRRGGIYGIDGLATVFPKWLPELLPGATLEASFGLGTRTSGNALKPKADSPRSKTFKYEKDTTLEAAYSLPQNQKTKLIEALGTGKTTLSSKSKFETTTKLLDNLRDAVFMGEGVQKKRVLDSWDKLTEKEKIAKLKEAINPNDNQQKADLYFALESVKQEWLYSSKSKTEFIQNAQTLLNLAAKNSNLIKGYNRQFVPIVAVLYKQGMSDKQMKLEHVKSSLEQSMQATIAIIEGRWLKDGKKIMNDFSGIISTKEYLNEIDAFGGTTNTAGIARMTANLENLKNYRTVESGFKETLYDKVLKEAAQEIGAKTRELGINFLENQLARYLANPTASNKVILKQAVNNKKAAKQVYDNNIKLAKKAGVKGTNNAEIITELSKKDKLNSKETKNRFASKDLNKEFNDLLEQSSGVESIKEFSDIRSKTIGKKKRKWQLFIPDSAADLNGLLDVTLGKGKKGDAQRKWYKENLLEPFARAEDALTTDRVALTSGFKALKKQLKIIPKDLRKEAVDGFTYEQAIRVHIWNKQGMAVEGLSKRDLKDLNDIVEKNPELQAFAEQLIELGKGEGYPPPGKEWLASTLATDLRTGLNKQGRAKYLEASGYTANVNKIYSKENLNKLEAIYGTKYRTALENMLGRMKSGRNRKPSANELENRAMDWINNANGVTMFLNARSSVLQTISNMNYINWTDNNPIKAGKAIANQPQFWKDFMEIMNSDYLVDRRNGLKLNVSESEIADAAKSSTNSAKGAINYLLSKGYVFTRIADSFAIASGGSTMYRNRINTYKKQGLTEAKAKEKAFRDFKEISEESQQSANVSRISMEQASTLGRLVLAFANTPMQYTRLQKRAILDLANGRGDYKTNISKIAYYGFVQNLLFNAMQNALFTNIWEDEPDESKEETKRIRIANGMLDSTLRGMGIGGALVSTMKNVMLKIKSESGKSRPKYQEAALEVFDFLPAIDSKVKKLISAGNSVSWNADEMRNRGLMDIDNPAYLAGANVISAATNFPADRIVKKITNMNGIMTDEMEMWQRVFRFAGWSEWEIGPQKGKKTSRSTKGMFDSSSSFSNSTDFSSSNKF